MIFLVCLSGDLASRFPALRLTVELAARQVTFWMGQNLLVHEYRSSSKDKKDLTKGSSDDVLHHHFLLLLTRHPSQWRATSEW